MPSVYEIEFYKTESGREPFSDYMRKLSKENRTLEIAQIRTFLDRLRMHGMDVINDYPRTIRKLTNSGVWELRPGGNRVFFFLFTGKTFVLLHAYPKHGQKAPPSEIKQAEKEMKDHLRRNQHG